MTKETALAKCGAVFPYNMNGPRYERRHPDPPNNREDVRDPGEHDCDRIKYTSAFQRLAGITQVAAADAGHLLHNRLTHVLEVAQIGRRLAQRLVRSQKKDMLESFGGIDPEVVEAVCLAHDLGHPPFGHIAEEVLNQKALEHNVTDGFEGNAQSFRIVTKLARGRGNYDGLNLTRATLNGLLKYPWPHGNTGKSKRKWGFYSNEEPDFSWARQLDPHTDRKSVEAELMDWADDIAYSVHDMIDFYMAGKIPLDRLVDTDSGETERFLESAFAVWKDQGIHENQSHDPYAEAFKELLWHTTFSIDRPFEGEAGQRHELRALSSFLITRYINGISLTVPADNKGSFVIIDPNMVTEVTMLKELT